MTIYFSILGLIKTIWLGTRSSRTKEHIDSMDGSRNRQANEFLKLFYIMGKLWVDHITYSYIHKKASFPQALFKRQLF